jgi:peptide-methionine (S)-S-oxide reductase
VEKATLGGGCFWCLEAVYQELKGIEGVVSGYAGGHVPEPTYRDVCAGTSGHAEVVQVTFDPEVVTFGELLDVFFTVHDPTQLNRQGADVGEQYRSVILFHDEGQRAVAEAKIAEIEQAGVWDRPVVTAVEALSAFYPAEAEHQDYFRRRPFQPYCLAVIRPKVAKLRAAHLDKLRAEG